MRRGCNRASVVVSKTEEGDEGQSRERRSLPPPPRGLPKVNFQGTRPLKTCRLFGKSTLCDSPGGGKLERQGPGGLQLPAVSRGRRRMVGRQRDAPMVTKSGYLHKRSFKGHKVAASPPKTSTPVPPQHPPPPTHRPSIAPPCPRDSSSRHRPAHQSWSDFVGRCSSPKEQPLQWGNDRFGRTREAEQRVWQDVVNAFLSDETRLFTASSDATIKVPPRSQLRTLALNSRVASQVDSLGVWYKPVNFGAQKTPVSPNR